MSLHLRFFAAIDRLPSLDTPVLATALGRARYLAPNVLVAFAAPALFILISAGVIGWAAAQRLLSPEPPVLLDEGRGMIVMGVSVVLTLALVWWQGRVARATGSKVATSLALGISSATCSQT